MRNLCVRTVAAAFACLLALGTAAEARAQHARRSPIVEAVQKNRAGIVTIKVARARATGGRSDITGTGVVIDERGFVITNRHVVGASKSVSVRLADGTELDA